MPAEPLSLEDFGDDNLNFSCTPAARSSGGSHIPPPSHDTATRSGWKTREMLNVMETLGRGYRGPWEGEGGGDGDARGVCSFLHTGTQGDFLRCKVPPPELFWVSQPGRASQLNLGPACSAGAVPSSRRCRMLLPGPAVPRNPAGATPSPGTSRRHRPQPQNPPELLGTPGKTRKN